MTFLKEPVHKFTSQVAQMFGDVWATLWKWHFLAKTFAITFGATFGKIGQIFTPTPGHTVYKQSNDGIQKRKKKTVENMLTDTRTAVIEEYR